jgi:hypothetical protein
VKPVTGKPRKRHTGAHLDTEAPRPGRANQNRYTHRHRTREVRTEAAPSPSSWPTGPADDSARCPQATHHPCHRPVWQQAVTSTTVFLGNLSRSQTTERTRLQAQLDRAQRVLADIDAASTPAIHTATTDTTGGA